VTSPADVLAVINHSISLVSRLREISKNIQQAEIKNLLADLSNELADAKMQVASLKERVAELTEENRGLKAVRSESKEKPTIQWGCYKFEGDEGLYCTGCYDSKGMKSLTHRRNSRFRYCPVCKTVIGSG
jgi:regulator of replication initiation timing